MGVGGDVAAVAQLHVRRKLSSWRFRQTYAHPVYGGHESGSGGTFETSNSFPTPQNPGSPRLRCGHVIVTKLLQYVVLRTATLLTCNTTYVLANNELKGYVLT